MIATRRLRLSDSEQIASMLSTASSSDRQWFHPFEFEAEVIRQQLMQCVRDLYFGWFLDKIPIALSMLRGLDESYASPMYGVFVHPDYRDLGLGGLSLKHSIVVSRIAKFPSLLLKVHDTNFVAKRIYEKHGFVQTEHKEGQFRYELRFRSRS